MNTCSATEVQGLLSIGWFWHPEHRTHLHATQLLTDSPLHSTPAVTTPGQHHDRANPASLLFPGLGMVCLSCCPATPISATAVTCQWCSASSRRLANLSCCTGLQFHAPHHTQAHSGSFPTEASSPSTNAYPAPDTRLQSLGGHTFLSYFSHFKSSIYSQ